MGERLIDKREGKKQQTNKLTEKKREDKKWERRISALNLSLLTS